MAAIVRVALRLFLMCCEERDMCSSCHSPGKVEVSRRKVHMSAELTAISWAIISTSRSHSGSSMHHARRSENWAGSPLDRRRLQFRLCI